LLHLCTINETFRMVLLTLYLSCLMMSPFPCDFIECYNILLMFNDEKKKIIILIC
jgi:hypothetical protein